MRGMDYANPRRSGTFCRVELGDWKDQAMRDIAAEVRSDPYWRRKLARGGFVVHLAVFVEPWLSWLLDGSKTIESRFSVRRGVPYEKVRAGDVLLLKKSSGPVVGICDVRRTWYFDVAAVPMKTIAERFGEAIGGGRAFWRSVQDARYVTLLEVRAPRAIAPIACPKKDRRGWVTFDSPPAPSAPKVAPGKKK